MPALTISIDCDSTPLNATVDALFAEFAKRSLEAVAVRLGAVQALAQPARIESRGFAAAGAGKCFVVLHASDALLRFLAAVRAGDFDV